MKSSILRRPLALGAVAAAFVVFAACSSADSLFSGGDSLDGGDDGGAGGSSSNNNSSNDTTTTNGPGTTTTGSAMGGHGGAGGMGEGGGPDVTIPCGASLMCSLADQGACCWDRWMQHGKPQAECVEGSYTSDDCNTSVAGDPMFGLETRIECHTADECDGQEICCAQRMFGGTVGNNYYESVECSTTCDPVINQFTLCHTLNDTSECPMIPDGLGGQVQSICKVSSLLPTGYLVCGAPG